MCAPVTHGRTQEGFGPRQFLRVAERAYVGRQVTQSHGSWQVAHLFEDLRTLGPLLELPVLFISETGVDEILGLAAFVYGDDHAVGGAGQRPDPVQKHGLTQDA